MRARVVLLAAEGKANVTIAQTLDLNPDTVGRWRRRYGVQGPKGLMDRPRSGRPATFKAEQKARVLQKATETPRDNGVPLSHWSTKELAALAIRAGITESIHPSTVGRWLNEADLQPHRIRYWLQSPDPDFEARMRDVTSVYLAAPERATRGIVTFSIDEKTSIQALERKRPDLPMRAGTPQRREHEYIRHGTQCLTAAFNVATGEVEARITLDRPSTVFAAVIEQVCGVHPDAPEVHLVMDQLNTHWSLEACRVVAEFSKVPFEAKHLRTGPQRRAFLCDPTKRVIFHFTPKHASWLNQVETWFSTLARKLIERGSFSSLANLKTQITEFIAYHNRFLARPYRWTYTGTPCRR